MVDSSGGRFGPPFCRAGFSALYAARPALVAFRFPLGLHSGAADGARGLVLTATVETARTSTFSTLITMGFLDDALLTPPETLTRIPGIKKRATRLRSPEGS